MKALRTSDNILLFEAPRIEFGIFDEPDVEKWGLFDSDNRVMMYAIDSNFNVVEFDPADKPEDYESGKYFFIDGEFVLNPNWVEPLPPLDEQVRILAESVAVIAQSAEESEEALCDIDESYNQRIADLEDALCELAEMLSQ